MSSDSLEAKSVMYR